MDLSLGVPRREVVDGVGAEPALAEDQLAHDLDPSADRHHSRGVGSGDVASPERRCRQGERDHEERAEIDRGMGQGERPLARAERAGALPGAARGRRVDVVVGSRSGSTLRGWRGGTSAMLTPSAASSRDPTRATPNRTPSVATVLRKSIVTAKAASAPAAIEGDAAQALATDERHHVRRHVDAAGRREHQDRRPERRQRGGAGDSGDDEDRGGLRRPDPQSPGLEEQLVAHRAGVPVGAGERRPEEHQEAGQQGDHRRSDAAREVADVEGGSRDEPGHLGADLRTRSSVLEDTPNRSGCCSHDRISRANWPRLCSRSTCCSAARSSAGETGRVFQAVAAKITPGTTMQAVEQHQDRAPPAQPGELDPEQPDHGRSSGSEPSVS